MDQPVLSTQRRGFLQGTLVFLGGLLGAKAAPGTATPGITQTPTRSGNRLRFYARNRVLVSAGAHEAGGVAERRGRRGALTVEPGGDSIGEYFSTDLGQSGAFGSSSSAGTGVELQTFRFSDGTLFGAGANERGADGTSHHAILGGTGRYAGARGTCSLKPHTGQECGPNWMEIEINLLT